MKPGMLLAGLGAGFLLWGAEFWEKKPYTTWSYKEANRVLSSSPWARAAQAVPAFDQMWKSLPPGMADKATVDMFGGQVMGSQVLAMTPTIELLVRWHSSLIVRQALVRMQFGDKAGMSPQAREFLSRPQRYYVITVSKIPSRLFEDRQSPELRDALARSAALRVEGLNDMRPEDLQIQVEPPALTVFYSFPRIQTIGKDHKEAEFQALVGPLRVNCRFRLSEMVRHGTPEL